MIPSSPSSTELPIQADTIIRRAEINDAEAVCDAAWKLTEVSAAAAHWSRAAFYPYVTAEPANGALQVKVLFVARAIATARTTASISLGNMNALLGQVVGFAAFSAIRTVGAGEATLENMAVGLAWQRQRIGERLLSAGMLWCRAQAAGSVFLEVRETNRAAIALYERAGFFVVGRRLAYYSGPLEDALQMQKLLHEVA
ncbi:MAG: GNAT family N-acetyltransferase [Acidobacteriaceae bacterium]